MGSTFVSFDGSREKEFTTSPGIARNIALTSGTQCVWVKKLSETTNDFAPPPFPGYDPYGREALAPLVREDVMRGLEELWASGFNALDGLRTPNNAEWPGQRDLWPSADADVDPSGVGLTTQIHMVGPPHSYRVNNDGPGGMRPRPENYQFFWLRDVNGNQTDRINDRLHAAWYWFDAPPAGAQLRTVVGYSAARVEIDPAKLGVSFIQATFFPPQEEMLAQHDNWWGHPEDYAAPIAANHTPTLQLCANWPVQSVQIIGGRSPIDLRPEFEDVPYTVITMLFHDHDPQMPANVRAAAGL